MEKALKAPLDGGKAWLNFIIIYLIGLTSMIGLYKVPPLMTALAESYQQTLVWASSLQSIVSLMGIIFCVPLGSILVKIGEKKSILISVVIMLVGALIGAFTANSTVFLVSRAVEGIGMAFIGIAAPALIAVWFSPKKRGLPMGIWSTWVGVSVLIAFNIAAGVTNIVGLKGMWFLNIILLVVFGILACLFVGHPEGKDATTRSQAKFTDALRSVPAWMLALLFVCFAFLSAMYINLGPTYIATEFGMEKAQASSYSSIFSITMIIGAFIVGAILNRWQNRRTELILATVLMVIAAIMMFNIPSTSLIIPFMLIIGFIYSTIPAVVWTLCPETMPRPELAGAAMAFALMGQKIGGTLAPIITSSVVEKAGGSWAAANIPAIVMAVLLAVFCILFLVTSKKQKKEQTLN